MKETLDMKIIGLKRQPEKTSDLHKKYADEIHGYDRLDYVLGTCDFIVNCLPYTKDTNEMFNLELF